MKPLIEIRSIPISIEYKLTNAKIERARANAEVEVTRDKGGFTMRSRPIKLNIDTFEARSSVSPTPMQSISENAEHGRKAAYEATARFAQEGAMLLNIHLDRDILSDIAESRTQQIKEFGLGFIPTHQAELNWTPSELNIKYEMDKLNFDWRSDGGRFEFIPADIEFIIKEYPRVVIEYVGGPIYVPPSADPDYEPVDVMA